MAILSRSIEIVHRNIDNDHHDRNQRFPNKMLGATLNLKSLKKVDFGNFLVGIDFFRPKILTQFSGFLVGLHNKFLNLSHGTMGLPPNSSYFHLILL